MLSGAWPQAPAAPNPPSLPSCLCLLPPRIKRGNKREKERGERGIGSQERRLWNKRPLFSPGRGCLPVPGSSGSACGPAPAAGRVCLRSETLLVPQRKSARPLERVHPVSGEFPGCGEGLAEGRLGLCGGHCRNARAHSHTLPRHAHEHTQQKGARRHVPTSDIAQGRRRLVWVPGSDHPRALQALLASSPQAP